MSINRIEIALIKRAKIFKCKKHSLKFFSFFRGRKERERECSLAYKTKFVSVPRRPPLQLACEYAFQGY